MGMATINDIGFQWHDILYNGGQAFDWAQGITFSFSFQTFFSAPLFAFTKVASLYLSSLILHPSVELIISGTF